MREGAIALFVPCTMWTINKERSMHFQVRAKLVQPARESSLVIARDTMRKRGIKPFASVVDVEFFPTQARAGQLADTANHLPPCKAVFDGIVDAGLLVDDTPEWVQSQRFWPAVKCDKGGPTGIGVMIVPVGSGA